MKESFMHQIAKGNQLLQLDNNVTYENIIDAFIPIQLKLLEQNMYFNLQFKNIENKMALDEIDK